MPYADQIRREADIQTMAVGLIVHAEQAEEILQKGQADLIALAREMLYNPNWAVDAAQKLGVDPQFQLVPPPYQYWLSRRAATDFSFYLAIPTLIGAGAYSLYKERALLSMADLPMFGVGLVVSFISAWICVRWLLRFIASHSFEVFAWYRIGFGLLVLLTSHLGWVSWGA